MTVTEFKHRLLEERAAMRTPIDFAELERRGILAAAEDLLELIMRRYERARPRS